MSTNEEMYSLQMKTNISNNQEEESWQTVSAIHNSSTQNDSSSTTCSSKPQEEYPHRIDLPIKFKNILSPNATIKAHRRANFLFRHSSDKIDTNLLLLLHGAGDTHTPYYNLSKEMNLPQCAMLSLSASCMDEGFTTLPFGLGYSWFDEMDYSTGLPLKRDDDRLISSLKGAVEKFDMLIDEIIQLWVPERIFLFGFSAGACLAMQTCWSRFERGKMSLGGAICVAGGVNQICTETFHKEGTEQKYVDDEEPIEKTPVLIIGGSKDEKYTPNTLCESIEFYNSSHIIKDDQKTSTSAPAAKAYIRKNKGHEMINSEEETKAIMAFVAEHMIRRMVAMEGFCEISSDQFMKQADS
jgi:predicted esterase